MGLSADNTAGKRRPAPRARRRPTGLEPRLEAVSRLRTVLAGQPFSPFTAADIPESRDRALANRIVTTALRHHGHITALLAEAMPKGMPKRSGALRAALHAGLAQLLYSDDIPDHSALDLAVETVKADPRALPFARLANGVLRQIQRERDTALARDPATLFPDWLRTRWSHAYGPASLSDFAQALTTTPPLDLTLAPTAQPDLTDQLNATPVLGDTVRLTTRDAAVRDLPGFATGQFWVQDAAAALPARLLRARSGLRVLDLCAAPGGKTAQLCAAGADVTALDLDETRMVRVRENLHRLGYAAEIVIADMLDYAPDALFDAILLDAPCSATGTFRRHPEVLFQRDEAGIRSRATLQRAMIGKAATLLAPGGTLVYCVCSLEAEEGESQAHHIADTPTLGLRPDPISPEEIEGWTDAITPEGFLRTHPGLTVPGPSGGTLDGFFAARFTKAP